MLHTAIATPFSNTSQLIARLQAQRLTKIPSLRKKVLDELEQHNTNRQIGSKLTYPLMVS